MPNAGVPVGSRFDFLWVCQAPSKYITVSRLLSPLRYNLLFPFMFTEALRHSRHIYFCGFFLTSCNLDLTLARKIGSYSLQDRSLTVPLGELRAYWVCQPFAEPHENVIQAQFPLTTLCARICFMLKIIECPIFAIRPTESFIHELECKHGLSLE